MSNKFTEQPTESFITNPANVGNMASKSNAMTQGQGQSTENSSKPFSSVDQYGNPILIKGLQLRPNGWTPDTLCAVSEQANQYVVMWDYKEEDGHWGQGHYYLFGPYAQCDKTTAFAEAMYGFGYMLTELVRKEDEEDDDEEDDE